MKALTIFVARKWKLNEHILNAFFGHQSYVVFDELKSLHSLNEVLFVQILLVCGFFVALRDFGDHRVKWRRDVSGCLLCVSRREFFVWSVLALPLAEQQRVALSGLEIDFFFFFWVFTIVFEGVEVAKTFGIYRLMCVEIWSLVVSKLIRVVVLLNAQVFEFWLALAYVQSWNSVSRGLSLNHHLVIVLGVHVLVERPWVTWPSVLHEPLHCLFVSVLCDYVLLAKVWFGGDALWLTLHGVHDGWNVSRVVGYLLIMSWGLLLLSWKLLRRHAVSA